MDSSRKSLRDPLVAEPFSSLEHGSQQSVPSLSLLLLTSAALLLFVQRGYDTSRPAAPALGDTLPVLHNTFPLLDDILPSIAPVLDDTFPLLDDTLSLVAGTLPLIAATLPNPTRSLYSSLFG